MPHTFHITGPKDAKITIVFAHGAGGAIITEKSMGGRVASMIAYGFVLRARFLNCFNLGYPFHPTEKLHSMRTTHLEEMKTPTLICQGTRDVFGLREEVSGHKLSKMIEILWFEDGNHDFRPKSHLRSHGRRTCHHHRQLSLHMDSGVA